MNKIFLLKPILLLTLCVIFNQAASAQTKIVTTGNNLVNPSDPYAADIVIGSDQQGGIRHDASIMWWTSGSASRISNTGDTFYLSQWSTTNPNIGLSAVIGGSSYFKGNVGIGTTNPQTSLHVVGTGATYEADNSKAISGGGLVIQGNIGGSRSAATGAQLEFVLPANPDGTNFWGQARIITVPGTASPGAVGKMILGTRRNVNKFGTGYQLYYGDDLVIDGLGNIGIGTLTPDQKLSVNGTIHSKAVNIDLTGWNDYVFKKDYQLRPLSEVKTYIEQNQHLPEIPSEQEMIKKGLDVAEINKLLMKKVEELTLYLIEVKNEYDSLKQQQKQIEQSQLKQLEELKQQLALLTKPQHQQ
ncbi:hypothetical protein G7092_19990 [Mucilaginibacter sp. HC2]|uniref:hypothetical protein n=1 Tax=Mucilaginibacter inviolabilis TaxID=2714892 RepID=UPI0014098978|nr:hypothetical protein [Mucilaginibacter inviolabilis]NHA06101.1 hypothetical protein [Mucilaginibacter inviolabilis]